MEQMSASAVETASVDAPTPLRGLPLLDLVIRQIELSPQTWDQQDWRCETGMCVAGWAAHLAGGRWLTPANDESGASYLAAEPEDPQSAVLLVHDDKARVKGLGIGARYRAQRLLGIGLDEADDLFESDNSLDYIKECRDLIAAGKPTPRYEDEEEFEDFITNRIVVQLSTVDNGEERVLRVMQARG